MQRTQAVARGVIADLVIPYSNQEEPDLDRLASETKVLDASGVHAISIGGVLGGSISATAAELALLCGVVRKSSRKPLFATVFPDASPEGFEMVRAVEEAGADAILVAQPHYLAQPAIEALEQMFADLQEFTTRPLLVADCLPGSILGAQTIRSLVEKRLVDGVLEAADMHVLVDLLNFRLGVPVYSGVEDLQFMSLILGADGVISNLASVFPRECSELYAAVNNRDYLKARKIHERLVRLWRTLSFGTEREARLRLALASCGRPVGSARSPYGKLPPAAMEQVSSILKKEGVLASAR